MSDELSINRFHTKGDRIYRVMQNYHAISIIHTWHSIPAPVAGAIDEQFPAVTHTVLVSGNRSRNTWLNHWGNSSARLYVKIADDATQKDVEEQIRTVVNDNHTSINSFLFLQPLEDMHLYSQFDNGLPAGGPIEYVRIFAIVAVFFLLIAGINYTNLATARSTLRLQEIGVRKAVGASQAWLIAQFTGESILLTALSTMIAASTIQLSML